MPLGHLPVVGPCQFLQRAPLTDAKQLVSFSLCDRAGRFGTPPIASGGPLFGTLFDTLPLLDEAHGVAERHRVEGTAAVQHRDYLLDTSLPLCYCLSVFDGSCSCFLKWFLTARTIFGWKRCRSASSSVMSFGCFLDFRFGMVPYEKQ